MKLLAAFFCIAISMNSFAADWVNTKFVCQAYDRQTDKALDKTVVLTQAGDATVGYSDEWDYEVTKIPFMLQVYEGLRDLSPKEFKGFVYSEDVSFNFVSSDKKLFFGIYLDELDESSLTVVQADGTEDYTEFVCF